MNIQQFDVLVTGLGIGYGATLIMGYFVRNKLYEAFRIDALFFPNPTEKTRLLNPIAGVLVLGYCLYSLFKQP